MADKITIDVLTLDSIQCARLRLHDGVHCRPAI